jgi:hypothetical protein
MQNKIGLLALLVLSLSTAAHAQVVQTTPVAPAPTPELQILDSSAATTTALPANTSSTAAAVVEAAAPAPTPWAGPGYTVKVSSKNLEDLQDYRNCVQFEFCSVNTTKFSKDGNKYVMDISSMITPAQLTQVINNCPLAKFNADIQFSNELGMVVSAPSPASDNFQSYYSNRKIQYLNENATDTLKANIGNFNERMHAAKFKETLQAVVDLSEMDLGGYELVYDPSNTFAGAVTHHDRKEIVFGSEFFHNLEGCQLIRIIRHEVEHVHQNERLEACAAQHTPSELADHNQRELSAHLNDALNIKNYCNSGSYARAHIQFLTGVAKDYIKRMGMGTLE